MKSGEGKAPERAVRTGSRAPERAGAAGAGAPTGPSDAGAAQAAGRGAGTADTAARGAGTATYRAAGVDVAAGEAAVCRIRPLARSTARAEVRGGLGGFAALFALEIGRYRAPLLASSTDGVGTKIEIARALGRHDTIGIDLVAMVVDDLVVCGAEPLFLLDYLACGHLDPERVATIVSGVAAGCRLAGCALVGGETAEHPGVLAPDAYDLAGAGVGVVEEDDVLGPDRVRCGDVVIAMGSSGLHSNGYSFVRHAVLAGEPGALSSCPPELSGATLGEALLTPSRIYARDCLALAGQPAAGVHAFAHITGGGLAANLARVLPPGLHAVLDRASWVRPGLLDYLARVTGASAAELEGVFNNGVGMVAVVAGGRGGVPARTALATLAARGVPAWVAGEIREGGTGVRLVGEHPRA